MSDISVTLKLSMSEYSLLREGLNSATALLGMELDATEVSDQRRRTQIKQKIAEIELFKGKLDA